MHRPHTIWFTQGFANLYHALNDVRSADTEGRFRLLCSNTNPDFVGFEAADAALQEPRASGAAYLKFVQSIARREQVRAIFPSQRQGLLDRHRALFEADGVRVVTVADDQTLALANNKAALYTRLRGAGIVEVPEYLTAATAEEFEHAYRTLRDRYDTVCFKPTVGVYGSGFRILKEGRDSMEDILSESARVNVDGILARMGKRRFPTLLLMQFLEGSERSVDCVAYEGRLVGGVIRRKSPRTGSAQVIERNPQLMAQVEHLTRELKLNGMFNVQFRDTGTHHYLLEINTRLSGRSFYATLAGLNLPYIAAQLFTGEKTVDEIEFETRSGFRIGNVSTGVVLAPALFTTNRSTGRESA